MVTFGDVLRAYFKKPHSEVVFVDEPANGLQCGWFSVDRMLNGGMATKPSVDGALGVRAKVAGAMLTHATVVAERATIFSPHVACSPSSVLFWAEKIRKCQPFGGGEAQVWWQYNHFNFTETIALAIAQDKEFMLIDSGSRTLYRVYPDRAPTIHTQLDYKLAEGTKFMVN